MEELVIQKVEFLNHQILWCTLGICIVVVLSTLYLDSRIDELIKNKKP